MTEADPAPRRERAPVRIALSMAIELDEDGHIKTSLGRQGDIAEDPLGYVKAVRSGVASLEASLEEAVHGARRRRMTWEEIGDALGVTRQSAWEKYAID